MNKVIHHRAHRQAHSFVALFYHDLPADWTDNVEDNQYDLELWLAGFDVHVHDTGLSGFALLKEVHRRSENRYRSDFKQAHHTLTDWSFYRFRLGAALLSTIEATQSELRAFYIYHTLLDAEVYRIGPMGQDRPTTSPF